MGVRLMITISLQRNLRGGFQCRSARFGFRVGKVEGDRLSAASRLHKPPRAPIPVQRNGDLTSLGRKNATSHQ